MKTTAQKVLDAQLSLDAQLRALRIPLFRFPWPAACADNLECVEKKTVEWADQHGLLVDKAYRKRAERSRYAWLAGRCYPKADEELLQVVSDLMIWFFIVDDLFVDRVEVLTLDTLRNLTAIIDVLDYNCLGQDPVFGEAAWLDLIQRLQKLLSAEHFSRFAQGMRLWVTTAGLQILNHINPKSVGIRQYETIRCHTSGTNPCLALADAANGGSVDPDEFYSSDAQILLRHANNIVCWSNDIQSSIVEMRQPGQFRNMVVIYAENGRTLQESVDYTAERVRREISSFATLAEQVKLYGSPRLRGFVEGLQYWIRGYQDWVELDTERYSANHAAADADDRGLI